MKYRIYELSARLIMSYAEKVNDEYTFFLDEAKTQKCISQKAPMYQDDSALFYQTMCAKHGGTFPKTIVGESTNELSDIIIYVDFSGIFDRKAVQKKYTDRKEQAEAMFKPTGINLDFGSGYRKYLAFERSGSMSRNSRLSFIREDFYEAVSKRIMLDMDIGLCQLSKLYAYNGLMLTSGFRVDDLNIWDERKIAVIDNPVSTVYEANIITLEDDGSDSSIRKYYRTEKKTDLEVTEFDGEGLISKEYSEFIDSLYCGKNIHSSFQIRMPYIKGVVHKVDLKNLFSELGVPYIIDIWGEKHNINDVSLILTKSMFKGFSWMTENGISFKEYLLRCKNYHHALYISGINQTSPQRFTELNYQFLNTVSMTSDEFRPLDLPLGWKSNPRNDKRYWITKNTEIMYYELVADEQGRLNYFLKALKDEYKGTQNYYLASILKRNPLFIGEDIYINELNAKAKNVLKNYSLGRLVVSGDNRYLSGDLMRLIKFLVKAVANEDSFFDGTVSRIESECFTGATAYVPGLNFSENMKLTLLRNPHIARNEEAVVSPATEIGYLRNKYLSNLTYTVMVDSRTLIPERLGGADFDGDMVKIIADEVLNTCATRNYAENNFDEFGYQYGIPLLKIPTASPQIKDAKDWKARFETVKNTFSTRIGQICNAAFDRSIVAYDENSDAEERKRLREETEVLEILTGLEIDSVKSGIKPDLSEFLDKKTVSRSPFLKFKRITDETATHEWYAPTQKQRLDKYFESYDWDNMTSNVERLPYLSKALEDYTPKIKSKPAYDNELFTFAKKRNWKEKLNQADVEYMKSIISDYEQAIIRIRGSRHIPDVKMPRKSDIERIIFSRSQEDEYTADELYSIFSNLRENEISCRRNTLKEEAWHFMPPEERKRLLAWFIPYGTPEHYFDFFSDFRNNGYRILIDIICDLDDAFRLSKTKKERHYRKGDSMLLKFFMSEYEKGLNPDYKNLIAILCRKHLHHNFDETTALKCAVALGKRSFAFEVLLDLIEENSVKGRWRQ